jgi:aspartate aminotransferase
MNKNKSPLAVILSKVKEAEDRGIKIINLAIGEPDFSVPDCIKKGVIEKIENNGKEVDGYTETLGIKPLRQAIVKRFNDELGKGKWTAQEVIVTPGAKFALAAAIRVIVMNSADTEIKPAVVILNPAWPAFASLVKFMGAVPVFVDTFEKDITLEMLEKAVEGFNLKAIIINSPSNPTGRILKIDELKVIGDFAEKKNIWIISDEIYRRISYIPLPSPMAYFAPERTITIGGFSKEYAMTGWRLGWAIAPEKIISEMETYQSVLVTCASSIVQYAGLFALESDESNAAVNKMIEGFAKRRKLVAEKLLEIPGIIFKKPEGTFYFFINIKEYLGKDKKIKISDDFTNYLFDEARVAVAPGSVFGAEGYIRLSFAASEEDLIQAIERIKTALLKLR